MLFFCFDFQTRDDGDAHDAEMTAARWIAMFVVRLFGDAVARRVSHADVVFKLAMLSLQMLPCEVVVA